MNKPTLALSLSDRASSGATVRHTHIVEAARWKNLPSKHTYGFPLRSDKLFALSGGDPVNVVEQGEGVEEEEQQQEVLPGPDG